MARSACDLLPPFASLILLRQVGAVAVQAIAAADSGSDAEHETVARLVLEDGVDVRSQVLVMGIRRSDEAGWARKARIYRSCLEQERLSVAQKVVADRDSGSGYPG